MILRVKIQMWHHLSGWLGLDPWAAAVVRDHGGGEGPQKRPEGEAGKHIIGGMGESSPGRRGSSPKLLRTR